jgi:hypothetical protein
VSDRLLNGRYRLEAPLGRGGMATVWRARDTRLERPVAVKIMDHAGLDDPVAAERFDREAHTVARLTNPNIVAVYDVGTHDGDPYLVMELVDGATVAQLVADGPLPAAQVVSIAEQICAALEAAHAAGVVHRDIKPANIMVTGDGRVKVCDFGIARHAYAAAQALTAPSTAVGTSAYMAPEQATGDPVDARADLYALGCVIYAMVTGGPPFVGERDIAVLYQHLQSAPAPLRSPRGDVPAALDDLVGRLLAKNPEDRPASAGKVRDELARIARGLGRDATGAPVTAALAARAGAVRATAAVVSPTRSFPTDGYDGGYPPEDYLAGPPRRRSAFPLVAGFVMGLVIIALLLANLLSRSSSTPQGGPQPPTSAGSPTAPSAAPSTSAAPATTPASADAAVQALRTVLQQLVQTGQIDSGDAQDLSRRIDDIANALGRNGHHRHDVTDRIQSMRSKIDDLTKESKLSIAGATELYSALNQLEAVATSGGGGDNGGGDG